MIANQLKDALCKTYRYVRTKLKQCTYVMHIFMYVP